MTEKLKPCPVCGKTRYVSVIVGPRSLYRFACVICDVGEEAGKYKTEQEALKSWNALPRRDKDE